MAEATKYSAEDADVTLRLHMLLKPQLREEGKRCVYETLERPLVMVLADMERAGITIDPDLLRKLSNDFAKTAGRRWKTRSTSWRARSSISARPSSWAKSCSTDEAGRRAQDQDRRLVHRQRCAGRCGGARPSHRQESAGLARPGQAARHLYRRAARLHQSPRPGRVHTSYAMASTSTGRLASTDPNLQNIPVRTEEGRRIRQAFIAAKGNKLISADYSQIELRLLAHIADIPQLKKAFADNLDIHAMTASEIFGVPVKDMPAEVRRRAKAINFGIVYGISGFGLANQLGIAQSEASRLHQEIFRPLSRHPRLYGRHQAVRPHPWLCRNPVRAAHPYPRDQFQGAGLPRRGRARRHQRADPGRGRRHHPPRHGARCRARWRTQKLKATMLLQVHDELIFEAPDKEVAKAAQADRRR